MIASPPINVRFFDDEGQHQYTLNGNPAPSVTTIMGAEGLVDYEWCEEKHRDRGHKVHRIAQLISRDWHGSTVEEVVQNSRWDVSKTTPTLVGFGYAAAKFILEQQFRPSLVEQPVGSVRMGICGTLDAFGVLPSGLSILPDYKSGRPLPAVWVQMALYAYMLEETFGIKVDQIAPVWLKANGDYQLWPSQPPGGLNLSVGQSAVNLFKWREKHKLLG